MHKKSLVALAGMSALLGGMEQAFPASPTPRKIQIGYQGKGNNADPRETKKRKRNRRRIGASNPGSHHHAGYLKREKKRRKLRSFEAAIRKWTPRRINEPSDRPMKCSCGSADIRENRDVGWDVGVGFEERQHVDVCRSCGKIRDWVELVENFTKYQVHWGEWREPFYKGGIL